MERAITALVGLVVFVFICSHCLTSRSEAIQADVRACAQDELARTNPSLRASVSGRDVELSGAPSAAAVGGLIDRIKGACHARVVEVGTGGGAYSTRLCVDHAELTVDGFLPDAALQQRLLDRAAVRFGRDSVHGEWTIRDGAPSGFAELMDALINAARQLDHGCMQVQDRVVEVEGELNSQHARSILVMAVDAGAGKNFDVRYSLSTATLSSAGQACQQAFDKLLATADTVLFDTDSVELRPEGRRLLDAVDEIAADCPQVSLLVAGHTDSAGEPAYNQQLSEQRARAVAEYLAAGGFDDARLTAIGFGEAQPRADNETEEGRANNRRIELRVRENRR